MIILLNGTSSSGKTTIAKQLQKKYPGVLLLYGLDTMVQTAFPEKCDYPPYDEQAIQVTTSEQDGHQIIRMKVSSYMYPVYQTAVQFYKMLSEQGYGIIVDEVLFDKNRITPFFEILSHEKVYFIGVKPSKDVVIRREQERGDRLVGLAAGLYDEVYNPYFTYDITLDTGTVIPEEAADRIIQFIGQTPEPQGFIKSRKAWMSQENKE
ncbi:MAG: chloramphenicol phosphotransferase CPT family protein [Methanospirillum sp.]|uniref:phosphotransferase-like protein n=1 Tax=Methanospirillum sp. TaxID=45200 RepID=UPI00237566D4|nr:AAA family ATPase [Methanospirillum sp.]MDD1730156.1 chloramphenicol phosphotransferase CPT family protein [Methanospirillum sp.]